MKPSSIKVHQKSGTVELAYGDESYALSFEFLRVHSPSAEVRGHGKGQEVLQTGKKNVKITGAAPVGNYAIQFMFSDGHDSGIYSWNYLYELCQEQEQRWQSYLSALEKAGASRDPDLQVLHFQP